MGTQYLRRLIMASLVAVSGISGCGGGGGGGEQLGPAPAPTVSEQPASLAVPDGSTATFSVKVSVNQALSYQWRRNGAPIPGATLAAYTTLPVSMADNLARFEVDITHASGTLRSEPAVLTVTPVGVAIKFSSPAQTVPDGSEVVLRVEVTGTGPLSYQWKRNGVPIGGATQSSLTFTADYSRPNDSYTALVSNAVSTVESSPINVTVNPRAVGFPLQPLAQRVTTGSPVTFIAEAIGTPPLRYQWQRSDDRGLRWTDLLGATSSSYRIANATLGDTDMLFRLAVSNDTATAYSNSAALTVQPNVRILAGYAGGPAYAEGQGSQARFDAPQGIVSDGDGNLYVADSNNHVIRRISPQGQTSVFAGQPGQAGHVNGPRLSAKLSYPKALALGPDGSLYFSEACSVRKVDTAGQVITIAGAPGRCVPVNGAAGQASFSDIRGLAVDAKGQIFVAENDQSYAVRRIAADGSVSTFAGKIGQREAGLIDGVGEQARFFELWAIAAAPNGDLYVIDGNVIRQISPEGRVSRFAGRLQGRAEGDRLTEARFLAPRALCVGAKGQIFVADNERLMRIDTNGMVVSMAGSAIPWSPTPPNVDGIGAAAVFSPLQGVTQKPDGTLAVTDGWAATIRLVSADARVSTLAGAAYRSGGTDGGNTVALLEWPRGLAIMGDGSVLAAESTPPWSRIRRVAMDGSVSTFASSYDGYKEGPLSSALFEGPIDLQADRAGNVFALEYRGRIRKISSAGMVSTLAGYPLDGSSDGAGEQARFKAPQAIRLDAAGNLLVADKGNCTVRKVSPDGMVSTLAGTAGACGHVDGARGQARFGAITSLALDSRGRIYVAESDNATIRRIDPDGLVSTVAGAPASYGVIDGLFPNSRLQSPAALAVDAQDNLYIADHGGGLIRRLTPGGLLTTVLGQAEVRALKPGVNGSVNRVMGIAVRSDGRLVVSTENALVTD